MVLSASLLGACGPLEERTGAPPVDEKPARDAVAGDVVVTLSTPHPSWGASEKVRVTVTLTNLSKDGVRVLEWHTPVEGLKADLFAITVDGVAVEYQGRHYKWATPVESDYLRLAAGESVSYPVDLGATYDFSRTGTYRVRFDPDAHGATASQLRSDTLDLVVEGRPFVDPGTEQAGPVSAMSLSTKNCSTTQTSVATVAYNEAMSMSQGALGHLLALSTPSPSLFTHYALWFGTSTPTNQNVVRAHFNAILAAFRDKPVVIDCGCTDSAYAYVYKNQPYRIYVCNAFWTAPMTGRDSKAGTLIHELSHFTVVADTDDWAFGHDACKSLAVYNPSRARDNADSHQYFAENTPLR
ncbi:M35 family metallo-endopeptidase [Myxococcus stipitatus]|uniref:M35 family metallo-endopeptidase n=1 Tax=Myxococcus stipitatus TaxID=83455 RepID=UPI0002F62815|nr:M35 family metallo-endopeptidase [Myxococcus stipitatus]